MDNNWLDDAIKRGVKFRDQCKYAGILITCNDMGTPISAEWDGKQEYAQISEELFWEWFTELVDEDGLYIGLIVDICGLLVELVEYNTNEWYWIVKKAD